MRASRDELQDEPLDLDAVLEETNRRAPAVRGMTERLFDRFLTDVASIVSST